MAEVHNELTRIAVAFPFLRMRAQLRPDSYKGFSLPDGVPPWEPQTGQWVVADGKVDYLAGERDLLIPEQPEAPFEPAAFIASLHTPGRERCVSIDRLREAIRQVEASRST